MKPDWISVTALLIATISIIWQICNHFNDRIGRIKVDIKVAKDAFFVLSVGQGDKIKTYPNIINVSVVNYGHNVRTIKLCYLERFDPNFNAVKIPVHKFPRKTISRSEIITFPIRPHDIIPDWRKFRVVVEDSFSKKYMSKLLTMSEIENELL